MKTIVLFLCASLLAGCGIFSVPQFDPMEYSRVIQIAADSRGGTCQADQTARLVKHSNYLVLYATYLPDNELTAEAVGLLDTTIQELHTRLGNGPISEVYCTLKLRVIHRMAIEIARTTGGKPR